jgi:hypothetical protein
MDIKETNYYLRSLAHFPPQAAFRYHRQPNEVPTLALEWVRFPDSSVLAAVAESAQVTTLVTSEGRTLTEIKLLLKNQAQPFLKVLLPAGASILSADVEGEKVKPVLAPDGNRVPLLRPGFRPTGTYTVSFVFIHAGTPFAKKGGSELALPAMDIPISLLHWEVFLPEQYKVTDFHGDAISANLIPTAFREEIAVGGIQTGDATATPASYPVATGQLGGLIVDPSGAVVPNVTVTVTNADTGLSTSTFTDEQGRWIISNMTSGKLNIRSEAMNFRTLDNNFAYRTDQPANFNFTLPVGTVSETVEVSGAAETVHGNSGVKSLPLAGRNIMQLQQMASANVMNLQRRVAGVLPVAIDVPRAGTSFQFVRPLVLGEETKVSFNYKSRG